MIIAYSVIFVLSLLLPVGYYLFVRKKQNEPWLFVLYLAICVVNLGYLLISVSGSVEFALFANKITYLGQVIVPMCMFMLVSKLCGFAYGRGMKYISITAAVLMFGIICTTGYLDWYYTGASIEKVAGATVLHKEYGPLHLTNLIYVAAYFIAMIVILAISLKKRKSASQKHACIMLAIIIGNIAMWGVQKIIPWNFELLSITYIMSGAAFLAVWCMLQDYVHKRDIPKYTAAEQRRLGIGITTMSMEAKLSKVLKFVPADAPLGIREREMLEKILEGKRRREMAEELHLSENTVKTYTRTLYSKLGVSCREELYSLLLQDEDKT